MVEVTDGSLPVKQQVSITVVNVKPTVTIDPPAQPFIGVGTEFVTIGSFSDPGFGPWTLSIDYGDGQITQTNVPFTGDHTVNFEIHHTYSSQATYAIKVEVVDEEKGKGDAEISEVVLAQGAPEHVESWQFMDLAAGQSADLTLFNPKTGGMGTIHIADNCTDNDNEHVTIFFAIYDSDPMDPSRKGEFFDIQVSGDTDCAQMDLTYTSPKIKDGNFEFGYFPTNGGPWVRLFPNSTDPSKVDVSLDQNTGTIDVQFHSLTFLKGTVFSVGLAPATTTTTTTIVRPAVAEGPAPNAPVTDSSQSQAAAVAFTSSTQLSVAVAATGDSRGAVSGTVQGTSATTATAPATAAHASGEEEEDSFLLRWLKEADSTSASGRLAAPVDWQGQSLAVLPQFTAPRMELMTEELPLWAPLSFFDSPEYQGEKFALPEPVKVETATDQIEPETGASGWLAFAALAALGPWVQKAREREDRTRRSQFKLV
jgi:hypothetical protein